MKTKFLKKLFFTLVLALILILPIATSVNAATAFPTDQILYLTATVGETYDHVGISYHTASDDSYILFGTEVSNGEIVNPTKVTPTSTLWSYEKLSTDSDEYGFSERYVCKGTLTGLESKTKYYYQAIDGSVKSNIQSFESLAQGTEAKSFMFLTDIQSSGTGFQNAQTLINAIYNTCDVDPNLIVMTGDQVDRGGQEQQWKDYYTYIPTVATTLQANVPGNHEWYTTSGGGYITNEVYNQMTNNPLNGPEDRIGSSYFFKNGNVLFIMLDIVKVDYNVKAQQEWFRNVVKNNPAKWIIVGSHPGMYATGAYASDAATMRKNWLSVFEECQVDLALNGHEHVYARKNIRYGGLAGSTNAGEKDEALGVTYLQGSAAGLKLYTPNKDLLDDYDYYDYYKNNNGVVITIDGDELNVKRILASGVVDDEFTLYAKRPDEVTTMTDQEILDSFNIEFDEEASSVTIDWDGNIYGNAKNINIKGGNIKGDGVDIPVVTSSLVSKTWKGYYTSYNYYFTVTITKNDGSTITKNLDLILNKDLLDYKINYDLDGGTNHPDNPATYKGTDLPLNLDEFLKEPTKEGYLFVGWKLNDGNRVTNKVDLDEVADIKLTAVWEVAPFKITYVLDGGVNNPGNRDEVLPEDLPKKLYNAKDKEGYKFIGWELNGVIVTEIPATITSDITLIAKWQKSNCLITYELDGGVNTAKNPSSFNPAYTPVKLYEPTKEGYIFKGWMLNGEIVTEIPTTATDDITLTATWQKEEKPVVYTITYKLNDGTNNSSNPTSYEASDLPIKLNDPTKKKYEFKGWSLNGKIVNEIPEGTTGDITLEATWEKAKGCKKSNATEIIFAIGLLAGAVLILRKKH